MSREDDAFDVLLDVPALVERYRLAEDAAQRAAAAAALTQQVSAAARATKVLSQAAAVACRDAGMTYAQIGEVMGVSAQRAYEIKVGRSGGRRS